MSIDTIPQTDDQTDVVAMDTPSTNGRGIVVDDDLLQTLERNAFAQNYYAFLDAIEGVDWSERPPDHIVDAAKLAVTVGAPPLAMQLAQEAVRLFPDHPRCQWAARVIAPAKVIGTRPGTAASKGLSASMDWIADNTKAYRGTWVAVSHGTLVASASSFLALKEMIKDEDEPGSILISHVL